MITDPTIALRKELEAALADLEPQIRGITNWLLLPESPELRQELIKAGEIRARRKLFLTQALDVCAALKVATNNLDEDDYPSLPLSKIPENLLVELQADDSDINKAASLFEAISHAATISIDLGEPADKP